MNNNQAPRYHNEAMSRPFGKPAPFHPLPDTLDAKASTVLSLKDGDILVVHVDGTPSSLASQHIKQLWLDILPKGVRVEIAAKAETFTVISAGPSS